MTPQQQSIQPNKAPPLHLSRAATEPFYPFERILSEDPDIAHFKGPIKHFRITDALAVPPPNLAVANPGWRVMVFARIRWNDGNGQTIAFLLNKLPRYIRITRVTCDSDPINSNLIDTASWSRNLPSQVLSGTIEPLSPTKKNSTSTTDSLPLASLPKGPTTNERIDEYFQSLMEEDKS
jgi:hypothetical protein